MVALSEAEFSLLSEGEHFFYLRKVGIIRQLSWLLRKKVNELGLVASHKNCFIQLAMVACIFQLRLPNCTTARECWRYGFYELLGKTSSEPLICKANTIAASFQRL